MISFTVKSESLKMNKLISVLIAVIAVFQLSDTPFCLAKSRHEKDYQREWCLKRNGKMEVVMPEGTRCDCLTSTHAIEFDFAPKWPEAIGQSLNYARQTGLKPGIVIICKRRNDRKKLALLKKNIDFYSLPITIWSIDCENE